MKRAALLLAALFAVAGCGTDSPPAPDRVTAPTTTEPVATAADIAQLRAELLRLESEVHTANVDRADLRSKVDRYIERASRSAARNRTTTARTAAVVTGDVWWRLALCESGGTNANTGNGFYGYFQFLPSTWRSVGGTDLPTDHGYTEQRHRAQILRARSGWSPWPSCSRKLGLR